MGPPTVIKVEGLILIVPISALAELIASITRTIVATVMVAFFTLELPIVLPDYRT